MKPEPILRDEWLAALGETERVYDQSALTVMEIASTLGLGRCAAAVRVKKLVAAGDAVQVYKRIGSRVSVAYRLTPKKRK